MPAIQMGMRVALAAGAIAGATAAPAATPVHVSLSGAVSGYDTVFNGQALMDAFPLGTLISADLVIDRDADSVGNTTAAGTVSFGGISYAITTAYFQQVAFTQAGQSYSYASVALNAPVVMPSYPGYKPGTLFFGFTLPYPNPFATAGISFESNIGATFQTSDGHGFENDRANLTVRTALVTPVPEPASWALLVAGFGTIGAVLRRRPRRVTCRA